jgi:predicted O-methyltransferase YrrM
MNLEKVYNDYQRFIELSFGDAEVIRNYVRNIKSPNCYVEIGTKYGGSAVIVKNAVPEGIEVYSIDSIDNYLKDSDGILDKSNINFITKESLLAARDWNKPIEVLFIDGNHSQAQQDFGAWEKYVVHGGIVLFHDYAGHSPDVISQCNNGIMVMSSSYKILYIPNEDRQPTSILQAQKL